MKKRDYTLDLIRLISIFFVVVIHVSNYYNRFLNDLDSSSYFIATLYNSIARISVPLFFMISGALILNEELDGKKIFLKIKHFVFVLTIWTIIYLIFDYTFMEKTFTKEEFINLIFEPLKPHLWFMYAIISLYIITPFVQVLVKNMDHHLENVFFILWSSFTGAVQLLRIVLDYFNLESDITYSIPLVQGTYYLGYYMMGFILYNRIKNNEINHKTPYIIIYVISTLSIFTGTFFMTNYENTYFADLLSYRNLFIIFASISFFIVILKKVHIKNQKLKELLKTISPNLFGVYLFHIIPFDILIRTFKIKTIHAIIGIPIYSIYIFITSFLVVYLLSKIKILKNIFK